MPPIFQQSNVTVSRLLRVCGCTGTGWSITSKSVAAAVVYAVLKKTFASVAVVPAGLTLLRVQGSHGS